MRIRDLLQNNLFLIWFSAIIGAAASYMLENALAPCNTSYLNGLIPPEDCKYVNLGIDFPLGIVALMAFLLLGVYYLIRLVEYVKQRSKQRDHQGRVASDVSAT